ncbi:MAG: hypothetical protein IJ036_03680 [Lachnospiraceae bacterium]|nr:hypothetical protein [Lachnospiraceae bacterium]
MKCFSCREEFDYENYHGICPRCGCFNKPETAEEQHQQMHDVYDGGYTHSESAHSFPGSSAPAYQAEQKKGVQGSTVFLCVSIVIFLLVAVGGTAFAVNQDQPEQKEQTEGSDGRIAVRDHEMGAVFGYEHTFLGVMETRVLATDEELNIPEGKKLIGVKLKSARGQNWTEEDSDYYYYYGYSYIQCDEIAYGGIDPYDFDIYGKIFGWPAFNEANLSERDQAEGWLGFLVDEGAETITLYLEECEDHSGEVIRVHAIPLQLEALEQTDDKEVE